MQKILSHALRLGLFVACIVYMVFSVDMLRAWAALISVDSLWVVVGSLGICLSVYLGGVRLRVLSGERIRTQDGVNATLLTLTANIILPGRVGEAAKVGTLRLAGLPLGDTVRVILLERLTDLNLSASIALLALGYLLPGQRLWLWAGLALAWVLLVLLLAWPALAHGPLSRLVGMVPWDKAREWLGKALNALLAETPPRQIVGLAVSSVACLGVYFAANAIVIRYGCGVDLPWLALVSVVCIGMLSLAVPAAPAGLGVYEAGVVWVLGLFGIDPERALVAALVSHAIQVFPILPWTGVVMLTNKALCLISRGKD